MVEEIDLKDWLINKLYFALSTDNYAKNAVIEQTLLDVGRYAENAGFKIVKEKTEL